MIAARIGHISIGQSMDNPCYPSHLCHDVWVESRGAHEAGTQADYPQWFSAFISDRATRKPSPHTAKAYRQDFSAIALQLVGAGSRVGELRPHDITKNAMRAAFAAYAESHEPASIRRCWSTWNTICTFLFANEEIPMNPMPLIGRPKIAKTLPKAIDGDTVAQLLAVIAADSDSSLRTDWAQRDRALLLTALLAGLRADELVRSNIGDIRATEDGGVINVRGKGGKDRRIPVEEGLIAVLEDYLHSRASRFPGTTKRRSADATLAAWPSNAPLFVGSDGERVTRGTVQSRVLRAYKKAGLNGQRPRGALVHGLRHTYATELANADVSVYTLMKLLGHESMATSQRYVAGAGTENRDAAARNPLYQFTEEQRRLDR
jgi:site-specific recombinase XerC